MSSQRTVHEESTLRLELTGLHGTRLYTEENIQIRQAERDRYHFTNTRCDVITKEQTVDEILSRRTGPQGQRGPSHPSETITVLTINDCRLIEDYFFTAKSAKLEDLKEGMIKTREQ
jgi:hypothetical protein